MRPNPVPVNSSRRWLLAFAMALAGLVASGNVWGAIGTVTHVSGVLVAHRGAETRILAPQSSVQEGDVLVSEGRSFARIRFTDGGNLLVRPNSRIVVERYQFEAERPEDDSVSMNLVRGGMRAITGTVGSRSSDRHVTTTATATIGIRGTHYGLQQCAGDCTDLSNISGRPLEDGLHIDVLKGSVTARNEAGELIVAAGQFGYVRDARTPPALRPPEEGFRAGVPPSMATAEGGGATIGQNGQDNICVIR